MGDQGKQGGCLCGAVRFSAVPNELEHGACHCSTCRKVNSGPFMAVECGASVSIENGTELGKYRSSEWAERWFCKKCGTALFYKLVDLDYFVTSVEAFDDSDQFVFSSQIFIDEKPARYEFANDTLKKTGAEVIDAFLKSQAGTTRENGEAC